MLKLRSLGYMGDNRNCHPHFLGRHPGKMPFFIDKLSPVVMMIVIVELMDRRWRSAVKNGGGGELQAIAKLGRLAFPVGILILLFAVLQFH